MILYFLKLLTFVLRTTTKNSGTALPGLLLEKYFPNTLKKLLTQLDEIILITGTNGKTTTTQMMCHLLQAQSVDFVTNTSGSNLIRGIASSVLDKTKNGKVQAKLGIFEVEEATMPILTKLVRPRLIVVTNIFRDQLDAYGEIDKTLRYIREAIESSNNPILILNGDDPRVQNLSNYSNGEINLVKLDPKLLEQIKFEDSNVEAKSSITINTKVWNVKNISIDDDLNSTFNIFSNENNFENVRLKVPGIHNTINATSAIVAANHLSKTTEFKDLESFEPAFGRGEIIKVKRKEKSDNVIPSEVEGSDSSNNHEKSFQILLAKNPAGMNLNLHLLENVKNREGVLLILNDRIADGKDVSWIWDVDFAILRNLNFKKVYVAGSRRGDLAIRMKYEGIRVEKIFDTVDNAVDNLKESELDKFFVLPTYTAMREFRESVSRYTKVKEIWRQ